MKINKLITAGFFACAFVSAADADNLMKVTGSTAFRGQTTSAIINIFDATLNGNNVPVKYGFINNSGGTLTATQVGKSSVAIFEGYIGGVFTVIKTHWTGSEGGIQTVSGQQNVTFLQADSDYSSNSSGNGYSSGNGTLLANNTAQPDNSVPDVAMSDTYQATSQFNGLFRTVTYPALNQSDSTAGLSLGNQIVGVVPFQFVASSTNSNPGGGTLTNITPQLARNLFLVGKASLALYTGVNADRNFTVYATGRDFDSGTRLSTFAEMGLGALATVKQYEPTKGGSVANTTGGTLDYPYTIWPSGSVNNVPYGTGNGGYNSGGDLANALGNVTTNNTCLVSYLGTGDASAAITGGAHALTFNGVAYSATAIQEGQYTFWGYEHLYYRDGSPVKALADKLALQIYNTDAPAPHIVDMGVSRTSDGGTVSPNYTLH